MRPSGAINPKGVPARLLDKLETEDRWATSPELALWLDAKQETVDKALFRLRDKGMVHSRFLNRPSKGRFGGFTEWRFGPGVSITVPPARSRQGWTRPSVEKPRKRVGAVAVRCQCGRRGIANRALVSGGSVSQCSECA